MLTDLDSTNGTRVNGLDCQLRILRFGDVISVGRSILLYGSRDEIAYHVGDGLTVDNLAAASRKTSILNSPIPANFPHAFDS